MFCIYSRIQYFCKLLAARNNVDSSAVKSVGSRLHELELAPPLERLSCVFGRMRVNLTKSVLMFCFNTFSQFL